MLTNLTETSPMSKDMGKKPTKTRNVNRTEKIVVPRTLTSTVIDFISNREQFSIILD